MLWRLLLIWLCYGLNGIIFQSVFVHADSTALQNESHWLPIPDIHLYSSSHTGKHNNFLHQEYQQRQYEAFKRLHYVEPVDAEAWWAPWDDVLVSYPIEASMAVQVKDKYIVGPSMLHSLQDKFILYAAGIADQPEFEEEIAKRFNISVHAFDCTIPSTTELKNNVKFHHWCLGQNDANFENNQYSRRSANKTFVFHSLSETKLLLGHHHIHALKMDIEGFEWDILKYNILDNPNVDDLPDQIIVELHAIGANPRFVPKHLSQDKSRRKVNEFILSMWKKGYRVVSKIINFADRHCADVTFLRIH